MLSNDCRSRSYKQNWSVRYADFQYSYWLRQNFQPIRVFKISVAQLYAGNYIYRIGPKH